VRLAIASDIHLEFGSIELTNDQNADVLILAGDICVARDIELAGKNMYSNRKRTDRYMEFFQQVSKAFPKVIYVVGNHEHYDGDVKYTNGILKRALAEFDNIHILEKETLELDDITFIGATIWTDMNGGDPLTLQGIKNAMNDFRCINNSNNMVSRKVPLYDNEHLAANPEGYVVRNVIGHKFKEEASKFTPTDAMDDHKQAIDYINHVVANDTTKKYVVVGHHAPSMQSCADRFRGDRIMNGGFYTELGDFIAYRPEIKLWVHGHTHDTYDYVIGETRVVCNPRGYIGYEDRAEEFELLYVDII
jgi:Icc-related predicted phosphoesterase